jgi:hypothetical protein
MADTKISGLPAASALTGSELLAGDQSATSVGVSTAQIVTLALGSSSSSTVGFYGKTPAAQTASNSSMQTSNASSAVASVTGSATTMVSSNLNLHASAINVNAKMLQQVINVLYAIGIYATH